MPLIEAVGKPIVTGNCQDENQKRKFLSRLWHLIAASLFLPLTAPGPRRRKKAKNPLSVVVCLLTTGVLISVRPRPGAGVPGETAHDAFSSRSPAPRF